MAERPFFVDSNGRPLRRPRPPRPVLSSPLPPVLDKHEVAVLLRLPDPTSVERLVQRRALAHIRIGGRILFLTESVLDALRRREKKALLPEEAESIVRAIAPRRQRQSSPSGGRPRS